MEKGLLAFKKSLLAMCCFALLLTVPACKEKEKDREGHKKHYRTEHKEKKHHEKKHNKHEKKHHDGKKHEKKHHKMGHAKEGMMEEEEMEEGYHAPMMKE